MTLNADLSNLVADIEAFDKARAYQLQALSALDESRDADIELLNLPYAEAKRRLGLYGAEYDEWRNQATAKRRTFTKERTRITGCIGDLNTKLKAKRQKKADLEDRLQRFESMAELGIGHDPFELLEAQQDALRNVMAQGVSLGRRGKVLSVTKEYLLSKADADRAALAAGQIIGDPQRLITALTGLLDEFGDLARTKVEEEAVHNAKDVLRALKKAQRGAK